MKVEFDNSFGAQIPNDNNQHNFWIRANLNNPNRSNRKI